MRKSSQFSFKRGSLGKLRTLAHSVASSKFQQFIGNRLLMNLMVKFGITERAAYVKQYGEDFTAFMLDGKPLPMTADQIPEGDGVVNVGTPGHVDVRGTESAAFA